MSDTVLHWLFGGWFGAGSDPRDAKMREAKPRDSDRTSRSGLISLPPLAQASEAVPPTDAAIFAALRVGDRDTIDALYREAYADLCHFAYTFVRSRDTAEEIVQDVFVAVLNRHSAVPTQGTARGYLFGAVRHAALNALRHARVVARVTVDDTIDAPPGHSAPPIAVDEQFSQAERLRALETAMRQLSERQRQALLLRIRGRLAYGEVAKVLGISSDAARMLVNRAESELRRLLAPVLE